VFYLFLFICFAVRGFQTQGPVLARQTLLVPEPLHLGFFLRQGLANYLARLASNHNLPDLCFLSTQDERREPPASGCVFYINFGFVFQVLLFPSEWTMKNIQSQQHP
jgi:hypothetical protein